MTKLKPWIQQLYGKALDLDDPRPEQLCLHSMAVALGRINRFGGHTKQPWSVLQHSYVVRNLTCCRAGYRDSDSELWALLHDAHEAMIGDITTPVTLALEEECPGAASAIRRLKEQLDRSIIRTLGLPDEFPDEQVRATIKENDLIALELERRRFLCESERPWSHVLPASFQDDGLFVIDPSPVDATTWLHDIHCLAKIVRDA